MEANEYIERLTKEVDERTKKINDMKEIMESYPDLKVHINRWNTVRLSSAMINGKAEDFHDWHTCGCCGDAPLVCAPYVKVKEQFVYSDPVEIIIGEKVPYARDKLYDDWKETLKNHKVSELLIKKIEKNFNQQLDGSEEESYDLGSDDEN